MTLSCTIVAAQDSIWLDPIFLDTTYQYVPFQPLKVKTIQEMTLEMAEETDDPQIQIDAGSYYYRGEVVPRNIIKAKEHFQNALANLDKYTDYPYRSYFIDLANKYLKAIDEELQGYTSIIQSHTTPKPNMMRLFRNEPLWEEQRPSYIPQKVRVRLETKSVPVRPKTASPDEVVVRTKDSYYVRKRNVYDRYFDYNGMFSLYYFGFGYTHYFIENQHILNASTLDFRLSVVGVSPLNVELCVGPWSNRVTYKPTVQLYFPVANRFAVVPYAGVAVDASWVGTIFDKNYVYDKPKDFYMAAVGGLALNLTGSKQENGKGQVSFVIKLEYRHPLIQPEVGTKELTGLYLGAQFNIGSRFDQKQKQ